MKMPKMVTPARPSALSPARRGGVAILVVLGCENAKMVTPAIAPKTRHPHNTERPADACRWCSYVLKLLMCPAAAAETLSW